MSVSDGDWSPLFWWLSGFRESLPSSRMFTAPDAPFAGRPPVIWENGSVRLIWLSRWLAYRYAPKPASTAMRVSASPETRAMRPHRGRGRLRYGASPGAGGRAPGPPGPPDPPEASRAGCATSTAARPVADVLAGTRARPVGVVMTQRYRPTARRPGRHDGSGTKPGAYLHPVGEVADRAAQPVLRSAPARVAQPR